MSVTSPEPGLYELALTLTYGPALVATTEDAAGRIRLDVSNAGDFATYTITRVHPSGYQQLVRGFAGGPLDLDSGAATWYDHEAPIGRDLTYVCTLAGGTDPASLIVSTAARWDTLLAWLKDPAVPSRNMVVRVEDPGTEEYDVPVGVFAVPGRPDPITVSDVRRTSVGTLNLGTDTLGQMEALHLLTASGNPLLFQSDPGFGLGNLYIQAGSVLSQRPSRYGLEPTRQWQLTYTEVGVPADVGVQGVPTWAQVAAAYDSWAQLVSYEASWQDLEEGLNIDTGTPMPLLNWRGQ